MSIKNFCFAGQFTNNDFLSLEFEILGTENNKRELDWTNITKKHSLEYNTP